MHTWQKYVVRCEVAHAAHRCTECGRRQPRFRLAAGVHIILRGRNRLRFHCAAVVADAAVDAAAGTFIAPAATSLPDKSTERCAPAIHCAPTVHRAPAMHRAPATIGAADVADGTVESTTASLPAEGDGHAAEGAGSADTRSRRWARPDDELAVGGRQTGRGRRRCGD